MNFLDSDLMYAPSIGRHEIPNSYLNRVSFGGRTQTLRNAARRLLWQAPFSGWHAQLFGPPS